MLFTAVMLISEFLASNDGGLEDEDGNSPDWVEIFNDGTSALDLNGWHLTDDTGDLEMWSFPDVSLAPGEFLLVFASGKDRADDDGSELHTNFSLSAGGEYLALVDGTSVSPVVVSEFGTAVSDYPAQIANISYGVTSGNLRYYTTPTPGAANGAGFAGITQQPTMSLPRGFYSSSVSVSLAAASNPAGAQIYYTTNGSFPDATNGTLYTSPISINQTTALRASVVRPDFATVFAETATYFIGESQATQSLPVISLVADPQGTFSVANGLFEDIHARGRGAEFDVSFEVLDASRGTLLQQDAGIRLGGSVFTRAGRGQNPDSQWSWKIFFRDEYDTQGALDYGLMPGTTTSIFDNINLRSSSFDQNPMIRDPLARRLLEDMGQMSAEITFGMVFVNGEKQGNARYVISERVDEDSLQNKTGSTESWDVVTKWQDNGTAATHEPDKGHNEPYKFAIRDGDHVSFADLLAYAEDNNLAQAAHFQEMASRMDITNFVDYLLVEGFLHVRDWPQNNWVAARERSDSDLGLWRFFTWDSESWTTSEINNAFKVPGSPFNDGHIQPLTILYENLSASAEFRQLFSDRVFLHMFNDGALTTQNIVARFEEMRIELAQVLPSMSTWIRDQFAPQRPAYALASLENLGLFTFEGPTFLIDGVPQDGGAILAGQALSFATTVGPPTPPIYYTLDGSDPRAVGGGIQGSLFQTPFAVNAGVEVNARSFVNGEWSGLSKAFFSVGEAADATNLRVTEVHYNPVGPDAGEQALGFTDGDQFEFIEFTNTSVSDVINLAGVEFIEQAINGGNEGMSFVFGQLELAPGERAVVVNDIAAFEARYGTGINVAGEYSGKLSNGGETVTLHDAGGGVIQEFAYDDDAAANWPALADGDGPSLVVLDLEGDYSDGNNWAASTTNHGTPGSEEAAGLVGDINLDGTVNGQDLAILAANFGNTGQTLATGDITGDGSVNGQDLAILSAVFGTGAAPVPATSESDGDANQPLPQPEAKSVAGPEVVFEHEGAGVPEEADEPATPEVVAPAVPARGTRLERMSRLAQRAAAARPAINALALARTASPSRTPDDTGALSETKTDPRIRARRFDALTPNESREFLSKNTVSRHNDNRPGVS